MVDERHEHEAGKHRPGGDDRGIAQANDVPESEQSRRGVEFAHPAEFFTEGPTETAEEEVRAEHLGPRLHGLDEEVVHPADQHGSHEDLGRLAARFSGDQDFRGGRGFGERQFAVLLSAEIPPHGNEERDSQKPAQRARHERVPQADLEAEDVKRGQGEDCPSHDHARCRADGLDDDVFEDGALTLEQSGEAHGQNGDGNRRLEHLACNEAEVARREGKDDRHGYTQQHGPPSDFGRGFVRRNVRRITFTRCKGRVGVLR